MSPSDKEIALEQQLEKIAIHQMKIQDEAKKILLDYQTKLEKLENKLKDSVDKSVYNDLKAQYKLVEIKYKELQDEFSKNVTEEKEKMQKIINSLVTEEDILQKEIVKLKKELAKKKK